MPNYMHRPPSHYRGICPTVARSLSGDDEDDGLGFSLKKLVKKVTQPVLTVQKKVHAAVTKIAPKQLRPILRKVSASTERMTESTLRPFETPRLLKEEAAQIKGTLKQKEFQIAAIIVAAAVATYFTGGQATPAILALLKAAGERTAAKKAAAQSQAEADAAQAEFDAYAQSLAAQQSAQQAAAAASGSSAIPTSYAFTPAAPTGQAMTMTPYGDQAAASEGSPSVSVRPMTAGGIGGLPVWAIPVALGVALAVPLASKRKRR